TLKALIVDGQNNNNWKATTPVLKQLLEGTGLFVVDVATSPGKGQPMDSFKPDFAKYNVVVANYTGDEWSTETKAAFEKYIAGGGGLVIYHAADNAFPKWKEWNEMIALGGWGGRNEKSGPMVRYRDGMMVFDNTPGRGGSHGPQHEFQIVTRNGDHPITAGLPEKWMHAKDELYSMLRGPAKNITLLATSFADKEKGGSGENEPILFTVSYGKGRIFHTVLGHATDQLKCAGFIFTFQRGAEWAATGRVTQTDIPDDFPTADAVSLRTKSNAKLPADYGKEIVTWESDKDRQALAAIEEDIRNAMPQRLLRIETALLKALSNPRCTYAGKQWVCRMLRRMGSAQSVPTLAALLSDKKLSHMARFALQDMPAPQAGAALRKALNELAGDLKIGIVGSLGLRGDQQAVAQIIPLMKSDNKMMAQAAIKALSHIAGRQAGMALSRTEVADDLKMLKDDALLMCADRVLARGMTDIAASIYTPMTAKGKPVFIRIAAYRGLILARKENAASTIVTLLKDDNVDLQRAAGKFIVEMPGTEATKSFASQLPSLPTATQVILISALESRNDKAAAAAIARAAKSTDQAVNIAAVKALATLGDASSIPLLARLSTNAGDLGKEAIKSLTRLSGDGVSAALIKTAERPGDNAVRSNIIDVLVARREAGALGSLIKVAADRNPNVRTAAYKAIGTLGGKDELAKVVGMLIANKDSSERGALERALNSIAGRLGPDDAGAVIAGLRRADTDARARLISVLSRIGGSKALAAIRYQLKRSDGDIRKAAIRAMAAWSDPEPLEDLLTAAKTESDTSTQIIALRGYIKLASRPANRSAADSVKLLARALDAAKRPDEKKAVLAALPKFAGKDAMKLVESCAKDKSLAREAQLAAGKIKEAMINKRLKATASHGNNEAKNALDGNTGTRWTTGRGMKPGDWFIIDLGVEDAVKKITLDTKNSANDWPRGYEVYTSFDGGKWGKPVLVGKGTGPITVLDFGKGIETRYIKIIQTGSSDSWHWSIHKLNIEF
ncbi:MAG: HEAT repeat domain-containing protein, partial [Planctomycetes bacterium]|nr:HEAT repeat domain-containing protein [Planctomycetota bacterium]